MHQRDPRIDAYIARSAPFARPILEHIRAVVHDACPNVEESMKWSFPNFGYQGMLCSMAAFKAHCAFRFWKGDVLFGREGPRGNQALGADGRVTALADLPPKRVLVALVRKAMALNEAGVKAHWLEERNAKRTAAAKRLGAGKRPEAKVPADLAAALRKNAKAREHWAAFSPSHRREYVEWITSAKRAETRARRLGLALAQLAKGRSQNWRYESRRT